MPNFRSIILGSAASRRFSLYLRKLIKTVLLDTYRLFDRKLCVGRRNRLEKAKCHTSHRSGESITRIGVDWEELRAFSDKLKHESVKKGEFIEQENSCASTVSYQSPQIIEYCNVYYHPDYRCLYDEEGQRINSSIAWSKRFSLPEKIEPPKECKIIDQPFLYIGAFETYQYGHFLIEGISQLWALAENRDAPVFYANWMNSIRRVRMRRKKSYIDDFMSYLPIPRDDLYYSDHLIKFNKIRMPQHTSLFGNKMLNHHRLVPEFVAKKILEANESKFSEYETIYLSRSKLKDGARSIIHEDELEKRLSDMGVRIVYPESLSFVQQVILLNSCKNIIAGLGSALHNLLFVLGSDVNVYTISCKTIWRGTYHMIDKIKEAQFSNNYIYTMSSDSSDESEEWRQNKIIDVEETMAELSKSGLFD